MVSSKNVKVSQKRCPGTSIESFTGSSLSEENIDIEKTLCKLEDIHHQILLAKSHKNLTLLRGLVQFLIYGPKIAGEA